MKRTLRSSLSNYFKCVALITLVSLFGNKASAQCNGPYQEFESVRASLANMTAAGWAFTGSFAVTNSVLAAKSGQYSLSCAVATGAPVTHTATTPSIADPATFAFFGRRSGTVAANGFDFQINDGVNGWESLLNATNRGYYDVTAFNLPATNLSALTFAAGAPQYYVTFGNAPNNGRANTNVRFRFVDYRALTTETGTTVIDDISWKSKTALLNNKVIPLLGASTTCSSLPTLAPGDVYTFYDNGGSSDSYSNTQNNTVTFTPTNPADKIRITFVSYNSQATNDTFTVYDNNTAAAPILLNAHSGAANPGVTVYNATGATGAITMRFIADAGTVAAGYQITVECISGSVCQPPVAPINVTNPTSYSLDLSWTASPSLPASGYQIFWSTSNLATPAFPGANTATTAAGVTTRTVGGLLGNTTYYFWVRANCGGSQSTWIGPSTGVTTLCSPVGVPYAENFNGLLAGALSTCTSTDSPGNWQSNSVNGNMYCPVPNTWFYTKPLSLNDIDIYRLQYDFSAILGNANFEVWLVETDRNPVSNFGAPSDLRTLIATHSGVSTLTTNTVNFNVPLINFSGTFYIGFRLTGVSNAPNTQFNLDNVFIDVETCFPPIVGAATAITGTSATLNWALSSPTATYEIYYSTSNVTPNGSTVPIATSGAGTIALPISGLSPNTTYYVWIRSNCGGQKSTWSNYNNINYQSDPISFTTPVVVISNVCMTNGSVSSCLVNFTDSGCSAGDYLDNENYTYTVTSSTPGQQLRLQFSSFNTESGWDGLLIYDGPTTGFPLIPSGLPAGPFAPANSFYGTTLPPVIYSTNGQLTFVFRSDTSVVRSGWSAIITCVTRPTIASFTPTDNNCGSPVPVVITGTNFTGATAVTIGGVSAAFVINSATQITATVPAGVLSGVITVSNAQATGTSSTIFTVKSPPPTTTGANICQGATASITSATVCSGYVNSGTSMSGAWTAGDSTAFILPTSVSNSTACAFSASVVRNYATTNFQVSVTGIYTFTMASGFDAMAYITTGPFTAGSCGSGTFVVGDDDSGPGLEPQVSALLTAGVTYTMYSTTWSNASGTVVGPFSYSVVPPVGGQVMLFSNGNINWYSAASGGTLLGSGSPFNPVGTVVLPNTNTPGPYNFYAECSNNPGCRRLTVVNITGIVGGTASSNQSICSGSFAPLTLAGSSGTITEWQYASDAAFTVGVTPIASSNSATLTTVQIGSFTGTRYFRAVVTNGSCTLYSTVVTLTNNKTVWNGAAWSNGFPDATKAAEFTGNFNSSTPGATVGNLGNVTACGVNVISGTVVFDPLHTLTAHGAVQVTGGSLTFEDRASLYQPVDVANGVGVYSGGNSGNIVYKRTTSTITNRYDFTYWSTPVNPQTIGAFSPLSALAYYYDSAPATPAWTHASFATPMDVSRGYIIRAPNTYPTTVGPPTPWTGVFSGVPNNGTLNLGVFGGGGKRNLLGNPYPSALDVDLFLTTAPNSTILGGTIYYWTHNTPRDVNFQYTANDYALYNFTGTIGTTIGNSAINPGQNNNPAPRYMAAGQGFFIEGLSNGSAVFRNSMRVAGNNNNFFRTTEDSSTTLTSSELEKHRYWLNLTNEQGAFKQVLVGYIQNATMGLDRLFDGEMSDIGNVIGLYTKVDDKNLSIQGRSLPFDINDTIPLCYKSTIASTFTITLNEFDGLFEEQDVYLEDTVLGVIHNLNQSAYTFSTEVGTFDNRFVLRYTDTALGVNPVMNDNSVVIFKNDLGIFVDTGNVDINNVMVSDISGRIIMTATNVNAKTIQLTNLPQTKQVLLVTVKGVNGQTLTKKIVY